MTHASAVPAKGLYIGTALGSTQRPPTTTMGPQPRQSQPTIPPNKLDNSAASDADGLKREVEELRKRVARLAPLEKENDELFTQVQQLTVALAAKHAEDEDSPETQTARKRLHVALDEIDELKAEVNRLRQASGSTPSQGRAPLPLPKDPPPKVGEPNSARSKMEDQLRSMMLRNQALEMEVDQLKKALATAQSDAEDQIHALTQRNEGLQREVQRLSIALEEPRAAETARLAQGLPSARRCVQVTEPLESPTQLERVSRVALQRHLSVMAVRTELTEMGTEADQSELQTPKHSHGVTELGETQSHFAGFPQSQASSGAGEGQAWEQIYVMLKHTKEALEPLAALDTKWGPRIASWDDLPLTCDAWAKEMAVLRYNIKAAVKALKPKVTSPPFSPTEMDLETPVALPAVSILACPSVTVRPCGSVASNASSDLKSDSEAHTPTSQQWRCRNCDHGTSPSHKCGRHNPRPSIITSIPPSATPRSLIPMSFSDLSIGSHHSLPNSVSDHLKHKFEMLYGHTPSLEAWHPSPPQTETTASSTEVFAPDPIAQRARELATLERRLSSASRSPRGDAHTLDAQPDSLPRSLPPLRSSTSFKGPAGVPLDLGTFVHTAQLFTKLRTSGEGILHIDRVPHHLLCADRYASGRPPRYTLRLADAVTSCTIGFWEYLALHLYSSLGVETQGIKEDDWYDFCTTQGYLSVPSPSERRRSLRPVLTCVSPPGSASHRTPKQATKA